MWLCALLCAGGARAWSAEQLELYDLVEEVGSSFYDVLGVPQDASSKEIRKAFRTLSLSMHPDKSDSPTAEEEYRVVVAVGEVLRDAERRQAYDEVLRDGLPDWRHPVYYFRATAKMSVPGVLALLAVAATVVQAAGLWVGYFDRRAQARAAAARRTKRIKSKGVAAGGETVACVTSPTWRDLMWVRLAVWAHHAIVVAPEEARRVAKEQRDRAEAEAAPLARRQLAREREAELLSARIQQAREAGQRVQLAAPRAERPVVTQRRVEPAKKPLNKGPWTAADRSALAKLIVKFPGGTTDRWVRIAAELNRDTKQVLAEHQHAKAQVMRAGPQSPAPASAPAPAGPRPWTQPEQRLLEQALKSVPPTEPDRWGKIAEQLPERTKVEVLTRVRELVAVRKG